MNNTQPPVAARPQALDHADTIAKLKLENAGLRLKVEEYRRFKATYQHMREIFRLEQSYRAREKRGLEKAIKAIQQIADDTESTKFGLQDYAKRMLEVLDSFR